MRFPRLAVILVTGLLVGASTYGCSSDDNSSSDETTTTTQESSGQSASDVCTQNDALKQSVSALEDVKPTSGAVQALRSSLRDVQSDLQALAKGLKSELKPEVQAVTDSLSGLGQALRSVTSDGVKPVASAATEVSQSTHTLIDQVQSQKCG